MMTTKTPTIVTSRTHCDGRVYGWDRRGDEHLIGLIEHRGHEWVALSTSEQVTHVERTRKDIMWWVETHPW